MIKKLPVIVLALLLLMGCSSAFRHKGEAMYKAKKKDYPYTLMVKLQAYQHHKIQGFKPTSKTFVIYSADGKTYKGRAWAYKNVITTKRLLPTDSLNNVPLEQITNFHKYQGNDTIIVSHPQGQYVIKYFHHSVEYTVTGDWENMQRVTGLKPYLDYLERRIK